MSTAIIAHVNSHAVSIEHDGEMLHVRVDAMTFYRTPNVETAFEKFMAAFAFAEKFNR